jgi:hypothetical protein
LTAKKSMLQQGCTCYILLNMKNRTLALFVALCIIFCNGALYAQHKGGNRGGRSVPSFAGDGFISTDFDKTPFDITSINLPPGYIGHDPLIVYDILNSVKENASTGDQHFGGTYAFQVKPVEIFYDSRKHTLKVYVQLMTILTDEAENRTKRGFLVRYEPQMDNKYTYTDARGKKIEIEEVKFRKYAIAFEYPATFPIERVVIPSIAESMKNKFGKGNLETTLNDTLKQEVVIANFNVPSSEAAQLKESTRLLVLCNLIPPYTASTILYRKGTTDKPGEYHAAHAYLYVRLLELWFYDVITGKVMMKMKPTATS